MRSLRSDLIRQVDVIRYVVPFILFLVVTSYETWEHWFLDGIIRYNPHLTSEILFFGILGPTAVFIVLSYISHLLKNQIAAADELEVWNISLEKKVTERTEALQARNAELARANAELQKLDQLKSDFVSLVSHELRGPLTTLNGGLEIALQNAEQLPTDARAILDVMVRESQRLTDFVQTILDVSRLDAGKLVLTSGPVAVMPLLRRAAEVACTCEEQRIHWVVPEDLPPVWADEIYLEKIICNLLGNAAKYSPPDSPIELSAQLDNGDVNITVTDHGTGIPPEMQTRVFERFDRLEHGDLLSTKGWGLGLYFAKELAEAQGGRLSVQSPVYSTSESPGAAFTVTLPVTGEVPEDA